MPRFGWISVVALACLLFAGFVAYRTGRTQHLGFACVAVGFLFNDQRERAVQERRFLASERAHGRAAALKLEVRRLDTVGRWRGWVHAELERIEGAEALAQVLREREAEEERLPVLSRPIRGLPAVLLGAAVFAITVSVVVLLAG